MYTFGSIDRILSTIISPLAAGADVRIDIRTQVAPDIHLDIQEIIDNPTSPILKYWVKPEVTVHGLGLSRVIAPYGTPTKNYIPATILTIILIELLIFYAGYRSGLSR